MSVTDQTPRNVSTAAPGATVFPYQFKVISKFDLLVEVDGVAKAVDVDFTVSNVGADAGGDITFTVPMVGGETVMRKRDMEFTRSTDYQNLGDLRSGTLNLDQDAPILMLQQLRDLLSRALVLPNSSTGVDTQLDNIDPLQPIRLNAAGTAFEGFNLTPYDGVAGSDLIGFQQSGLGMVLRTLQAKNRDIVHANDRGLLGDGVTDETAGLQALLNAAAGKVLMLGYNRTYAIATATGLTIPPNTTLIANGSKFKRLTARSGTVTDADYNIIVSSDCDIDRLEVEAVGGISDVGGVVISGDRVRIGEIKVNAGSAGSGGLGSLWNAVRVGTNSGKSYDVHIGRIECANWDRPIFVRNVERFSIGFVSVTTYLRGVCFDNCGHGILRGGYIRGLSANATGLAGENGILFDCSLAHGETHDIRIENVTVDDAGEHAFRIGGTFIVRNVWHVNCHAKNPGAGNAGSYPPGNNGGCGFKALGPTATTAARHQNIHYIGCSVEDINATSIANLIARAGKSNFAGFQLGKVFGGSIVNPVVFKRPADSGTYGETGNSCYNGIEIIGCQKVTVTNPQVQRPAGSGVYIYDFSDGVNDWGQTDDIEILGGHVQTPGTAGVEIDCAVITMRRISIQGSMKVNAGQSTLKVNKSGTGAFTGCFADMHSINPSVESFAGLGTDWTIRAVGSFIGGNACRNGSFYQDDTNAVLKKRVSPGTWTNL